jgi:hypothetical protein
MVRQAVSALHEAIDENISAMSFDESYDTRRTDEADFRLIRQIEAFILFQRLRQIVHDHKVVGTAGVASARCLLMKVTTPAVPTTL